MIDLELIKLSLLFIGYVIHQTHVFPFRIQSETIDWNMIIFGIRRHENQKIKKKQRNSIYVAASLSLSLFQSSEKVSSLFSGKICCSSQSKSMKLMARIDMREKLSFTFCNLFEIYFVRFLRFSRWLSCVVVSMLWIECFGCDSTYKSWILLFYL